MTVTVMWSFIMVSEFSKSSLCLINVLYSVPSSSYYSNQIEGTLTIPDAAQYL